MLSLLNAKSFIEYECSVCKTKGTICPEPNGSFKVYPCYCTLVDMTEEEFAEYRP